MSTHVFPCPKCGAALPVNAKQTGLHHACDGSDRTVTATLAAPISKTSPVPARRVNSVKELTKEGDYLIDRTTPDKPRILCIIPGDVGFAGLPLFPNQGAHWEFSGTDDKPTLNPSILSRGSLGDWHGYLTDGVFVPC